METKNHAKKWVIKCKSMLLFYVNDGQSEMSRHKAFNLTPLKEFAVKEDLPRFAELINHPSLLRNSVIETEKIEGFDNRKKFYSL